MYNESNYINHTFYTELNKNLQICGLISISPIGSNKTANLIRPECSLKFRVVHSKYMDHIILQLEDIRKPGEIETKEAKVANFPILPTKPKRKVGSIGKVSYQLVDEIRIAGLQNYNVYEISNPIEFNIRDSEIQEKLSRYGTQPYKYGFIIDSLLTGSSAIQDTNMIFLICNGINGARDSLINGKLYKSLSIINMNKIRDWTKIKGESK